MITLILTRYLILVFLAVFILAPARYLCQKYLPEGYIKQILLTRIGP